MQFKWMCFQAIVTVRTLSGAPPRSDSVVRSIRHFGDTFFVTIRDGQVDGTWEYNLRSRDHKATRSGPRRTGLVGVGHGGNWAANMFPSPAEFGTFVSECCE